MQQPQGLYKSLRIQEVREEIKDFKTFVFEEGHGITYQAGQYLTLVKTIAGEEVRRSYSIISSPVLNEPLAIGVKRVENGAFSRKLVDGAKPGDKIITTGSGGFFVLPDEVLPVRRLFFFAAGSGITPVLSLIKTALHRFPKIDIVLVYSNAAAEKAVYLSVLQALALVFRGRFFLETLFSNAANLSKARLNRDLIFSFLEQYAGDEREATRFYICGPEAYMRLCTYTLQEKGIAPRNIRKENFYFREVAKRDAMPPDPKEYPVTICFNGEAHRIIVPFPYSILKAAQKAGLHLPYSCEAGRCGNCVALCKEGTVWHAYNEVLTQKELARGLVLTCTGHPVDGPVKLVI